MILNCHWYNETRRKSRLSFNSHTQRAIKKKRRSRQRIKDGKFEYQPDTFIMHFLRQQQHQNQFICLFFIFFTQIISIPVIQNVPSIRCNIRHQNCTLVYRTSPANSSSSSLLLQSITPPRTPSRPTFSTSRLRSTTTKAGFTDDFDAFSENLKRAALILAGIALGLGILRICLMLCKSRSRRNSLSNRHSSTVRPQVATIEHQFKPDVPPAYAEAIANMENDGGKLPTYEELPYEQRQVQHVYSNHGYISTQM
jgi:hypothetical protein